MQFHTLVLIPKRWFVMQKLRDFSQKQLPLILGIYLILQPLLDILTALAANAELPITAGVLVRALFMALTFLYVVFVSKFPGKRLCLTILVILLAYLAAFMCYMYSLGGLALCAENLKEVVKTFFAPLVLVFLWAIYQEYGHLVSTRAIAWAGGLYSGVILLAAMTGTSFVSYGSSGYGFKGWFYAANEVSCIIALTAPVTIYYCLQVISTITRATWWKGVLMAWVLISVAFSATFIGTKIVFGIVLLYCMAALVWMVVRARQSRTREDAYRVLILGGLTLLIIGLFFVSPLQSYLNNIYLEIMNEDSELLAASWGEEIQRASQGTWLRTLIRDNDFVQRLDQILSRRLFSASPSLQVYAEGGLAAKLLGIGYADVASYGRSVWFMIEMDPLAILIRHGIIGFTLYFVPYFCFFIWAIIQFFKRPFKRLASLNYCTYLYTSLAAFAIAAIAGHALVSPAVSTFVLVGGMQLWTVTKAQNQGLYTAEP